MKVKEESETEELALASESWLGLFLSLHLRSPAHLPKVSPTISFFCDNNRAEFYKVRYSQK